MNPTLLKVASLVIGTLLGGLYDLIAWKSNPEHKDKPFDIGAAWPRYAVGFLLGLAAAFGVPVEGPPASNLAALPLLFIFRRRSVVNPDMKRPSIFLLAILTALFVAPFARAQVGPTYETVYDFHKTAYTLVTAGTPTTTITNLGRPEWHIPDIPIYAFTGTTTNNQIPVVGFKTGYRFKLAGRKESTAIYGGVDLAWVQFQGRNGVPRLFVKLSF